MDTHLTMTNANKINDVIIILSEDFRVVSFNKTAEELFNISQNEVLGKNYIELQERFPETCPLLEEIKTSSLKKKYAAKKAKRITIIWQCLYVSESKFQSAIYILTTHQQILRKPKDDISIEDNTKSTLVNLKRIIDYMPGSVYWKDRNGVYQGCNQYMVDLVGAKSQEEVIGKTDYYFIETAGWDRELIESFRRDDFQVMSTGVPILNKIEIPFKSAQGEAIIQLHNKVPYRDENNQIIGVIGISIDVTAQKNAEAREKVAISNLVNLESIIACMPGSVFWKDRSGVYQGCNQYMVDLVGAKSREEVIGKTDYYFIETAGWDRELIESFRRDDFQVMSAGVPILNKLETSFVSASGEKIIQLTNKVPYRDENNQIIGVIGISIDVTAQKNAEAREKAAIQKAAIAKTLANAEKEHLEKQIEFFKNLTATVAHEMSTPLKGIQFGADIIKEYLPALLNGYEVAKQNKLNQTDIPPIPPRIFKRLTKTLANILKEVDYSFLFIEMLLANIRAEQLDGSFYKEFRIEDVIYQALNRYPFSEAQKKLIHTDISENFIYEGSDDLLMHILFNLIKNALYYIAKAGKGEIYIWTEAKKNHNELHFKDTGYGISADVLPHIFDHFYSKTPHGTGIGLAYSKMVMQSFRGDIICYSEEGNYAEFILNFPKV